VHKAVRDYFDAHLTPIAEAASVFGPDVAAGGGLHDIIEDVGVSAAQLFEWGVLDDVVAGVQSVTRRSDETYEELIARCCAHPPSRLVKWSTMPGTSLRIARWQRPTRRRRRRCLRADTDLPRADSWPRPA
jgi:hypothetical protein